jgi:hypothetical protein
MRGVKKMDHEHQEDVEQLIIEHLSSSTNMNHVVFLAALFPHLSIAKLSLKSQFLITLSPLFNLPQLLSINDIEHETSIYSILTMKQLAITSSVSDLQEIESSI